MFNGMGSGRSFKRRDLAFGRGKEGNLMAIMVWLSWHSLPDFGTVVIGPWIAMTCALDRTGIKCQSTKGRGKSQRDTGRT